MQQLSVPMAACVMRSGVAFQLSAAADGLCFDAQISSC
jgi:hypothetical protein